MRYLRAPRPSDSAPLCASKTDGPARDANLDYKRCCDGAGGDTIARGAQAPLQRVHARGRARLCLDRHEAAAPGAARTKRFDERHRVRQALDVGGVNLRLECTSVDSSRNSKKPMGAASDSTTAMSKPAPGPARWAGGQGGRPTETWSMERRSSAPTRASLGGRGTDWAAAVPIGPRGRRASRARTSAAEWASRSRLLAKSRSNSACGGWERRLGTAVGDGWGLWYLRGAAGGVSNGGGQFLKILLL
jgi:hypothetical protein